MKKYTLVMALLLLTACSPNNDQQALTQFNSGMESCKQQHLPDSAFINCVYTQYDALFKEQRLRYQDVLTQWRSEHLTIIRDKEEGKIPQSVATALVQQSEDRFVQAISERRQERAEADAQPPPILTLLEAVGSTTEAVHQVSDCTGGEAKKERCRQRSATDDYFSCLDAHDEYFCAPLKDKAGIH